MKGWRGRKRQERGHHSLQKLNIVFFTQKLFSFLCVRVCVCESVSVSVCVCVCVFLRVASQFDLSITKQNYLL